MQTTETFGDDRSGPPTPPWDKAREVRSQSACLKSINNEPFFIRIYRIQPIFISLNQGSLTRVLRDPD